MSENLDLIANWCGSTFYDSEDARVFTGDGSCDREKYFCDPKKIVILEEIMKRRGRIH